MGSRRDIKKLNRKVEELGKLLQTQEKLLQILIAIIVVGFFIIFARFFCSSYNNERQGQNEQRERIDPIHPEPRNRG